MTAVNNNNELKDKKPFVQCHIEFTPLSTSQTWDTIVLGSDIPANGDAEHTIAYGAAGGVGEARGATLGVATPPAPVQAPQEKPWYPDIQPFNIPQTIKWTPGYGDAYPKCGTVRFKVQCSEDSNHYETLARETCHRPACPTCYDVWALRAAKDAFFRVQGYKAASGTAYSPRHIVLSPHNVLLKDVPQDEALQWLYDETRRLSSVLGITAYLAIPHPYRIYPDKQKEISIAADKAGVNRYQYALSQSNWRELVYFSPHMHLIAYGRLINSKTFNDMTGWVYRNYGTRSGRSLESTIHYLLTHAWVRGNSKVCRYFKGMSTHLLKATGGGYTVEPVLCPVCKASCISLQGFVQEDGIFKTFIQDFKNATVTMRKVRYSPFYSLREAVKLEPKRSSDPGLQEISV